MLIGLRQKRTLLPPPQGEGDHAVVEGVYRQDTPPVSFADSPLWEGAKSRFLPMLRKVGKHDSKNLEGGYYL